MGSNRNKAIALIFCLVCFTPLFAYPDISGLKKEVTGDPNFDGNEPQDPALSCTPLLAQFSSPEESLTQEAKAASTKSDVLDTNRIQQAVDQLAPTATSGSQATSNPKPISAPIGCVELQSNGGKNVFISGPIVLHDGIFLKIDAGVTLFASRNPWLYNISNSKEICGAYGSGAGCNPLVMVGNYSGVIGAGTIDGQGEHSVLFQTVDLASKYGSYTNRAPVTSKCPVANEAGRTINTDELSWWDLAPCAAANSLEQNTPPLIKAFGASHVLFHDIHLLNSPHQHLIVKNTSDAMIWGIHIHVDSPSSAKNADGIDLSGVTNATVANSYIESGDDHIAIDAVSHAATAITIFGNHLYAGHGMSIGSEVLAGVSNVLVKNLTIDGGSIPVLKDQLILRAPGAITGLHIKSDDVNGGLVEKVVYENVCIRNTSYPIELQTNYSANLKVGDTSGSHYPSYRNIVMQNIYAFNDEFAAGPLVFNGYENASADVTNVTAVYLSNVLTDSSGVQSSLLPAYMKGSQSTTFRSRALTSSYSLLKLYGEVNFTPDDPSNTVANGHSGYINLNALPTQTQSSCLGTVGDLQFEPYR